MGTIHFIYNIYNKYSCVSNNRGISGLSEGDKQGNVSEMGRW